jgi:hypothetical protein
MSPSFNPMTNDPNAVCYQAPVGYVDEFYMYVWDSFQNNAVNGRTYLNQAVYIPGGFDFVLRRIVGLDSVLAPTTGKFQFRGANQENNYSAPIVASGAMRDQLIVPEMFYPQQSQIAFDLYNVEQRFVYGQSFVGCGANVEIICGQIGFAGVRRRRIGAMPTPGKFKRIPFQTTLTIPVYPQPNVLAAAGGSKFGPQTIGNAVSGNLTFSNYDVEVHMIQCVDINPDDIAPGPGTIPSGLNWFAVIPYNSSRTALTSGYVMSQYLSDAVPFGAPSVGSVNEVQDPTLASPTLYGMGAVVPPLIYPKETQFRMDAVSLVGNCETPYDWDTGGNLTVVLTGFQRIPC